MVDAKKISDDLVEITQTQKHVINKTELYQRKKALENELLEINNLIGIVEKED